MMIRFNAIRLVRAARAITAGWMAAMLSLSALADDFPNRTVKFVVPAAAGGPTDLSARVLANELSLLWKQPVVVDNRPGGGATVGTRLVATSPADGYTLLIAYLAHVTNPALFAKLPYDTKADFAPVAKMVDMATVIVVPPAFPANNLKEFVEHAKANPGKLKWAIASIGSTEHLAGSMLSDRANIKFLAVPYQGAAPALRDLLGGHADFKVEAVGTALPLIKTGKLKAIGVTTQQRSPLLPDVPSIAEQGFPGFGITAFVSLVAPARTPEAIVNKISADTATVLRRPDVAEKMLAIGASVDPTTPQEFGRFLDSQIAEFDTLITNMRLKGSN